MRTPTDPPYLWSERTQSVQTTQEHAFGNGNTPSPRGPIGPKWTGVAGSCKGVTENRAVGAPRDTMHPRVRGRRYLRQLGLQVPRVPLQLGIVRLQLLDLRLCRGIGGRGRLREMGVRGGPEDSGKQLHRQWGLARRPCERTAGHGVTQQNANTASLEASRPAPVPPAPTHPSAAPSNPSFHTCIPQRSPKSGQTDVTPHPGHAPRSEVQPVRGHCITASSHVPAPHMRAHAHGPSLSPFPQAPIVGVPCPLASVEEAKGHAHPPAVARGRGPHAAAIRVETGNPCTASAKKNPFHPAQGALGRGVFQPFAARTNTGMRARSSSAGHQLTSVDRMSVQQQSRHLNAWAHRG